MCLYILLRIVLQFCRIAGMVTEYKWYEKHVSLQLENKDVRNCFMT